MTNKGLDKHMPGHHRSTKEGTSNPGGEMGHMEEILEKRVSQLCLEGQVEVFKVIGESPV